MHFVVSEDLRMVSADRTYFKIRGKQKRLLSEQAKAKAQLAASNNSLITDKLVVELPIVEFELQQNIENLQTRLGEATTETVVQVAANLRDATAEVATNVKEATAEVQEKLESFAPENIIGNETASQLRSWAYGNIPNFIRLGFEVAFWCGCLNESKRGLKAITHYRKHVGPSVAFFLDNMMPTGIYGPVLGLVLRLLM